MKELNKHVIVFKINDKVEGVDGNNNTNIDHDQKYFS